MESQIEGNVSDESADLGTNSNIWDQVSVAEEVPTSTPVEPTTLPPSEPTPEPQTQPEQPVTEPDKADVDPFATMEPNAANFKALREHKDQILAEYNGVKPIVEKISQLPSADVIDLMTPFFTPVDLNDRESTQAALAKATESLEGIASYMPASDAIMEVAAWRRYKDGYTKWVMEEKGIDEAEYQQYRQWKETGQSLQMLAGFPQPDRDGIVRMVDEDGTEIELDLNDPGHKFTYNMAKREYERTQADAQAEQQRQAEATAARQQQAEQARQERVTAWIGERDTAADTLIKSLDFNAGTPADTSAATAMVLGLYSFALEHDAELQGLLKQGEAIAGQGGKAAADIALKIDRAVQSKLSEIHSNTMAVFKELAELRQRVQQGGPQLVSAPRTEQVIEQNSRPNGPASPVDEIWSTVR